MAELLPSEMLRIRAALHEAQQEGRPFTLLDEPPVDRGEGEGEAA